MVDIYYLNDEYRPDILARKSSSSLSPSSTIPAATLGGGLRFTKLADSAANLERIGTALSG